MEPFEPQPPPASIGLVGEDRQESARSKRGRQVSAVDVQGTSEILLETMDLQPTDQSAPQRLRKRKTRYPSLPTRRSARLIPTPPGADDAASASDSDSEATHTHLVTTPREKRVKRDLAAEQPPPPPPLAASQRQFRPNLSRGRRALHGASHRFGLLYYLQIFTTYLQCIGCHRAAPGHFSFTQMTWHPLGTGNPYPRH
jgi:hypothetical protein